jgi:ligand-binding sensor domain-containing protein
VWNGWTRRYSVAEGLQERIVWSVSRAPDGRIWVGTNDGLSVLDHGRFNQVLRGAQLPHPHAYNVLAEADRVWIGTRRGLVIWRDGKLEAPSLFAPMASAQINGIVLDSTACAGFRPPMACSASRTDGSRAGTGRRPEGSARAPGARAARRTHAGRLAGGLFILEGGKLRELADAGLPPGQDITALYESREGRMGGGRLSERAYVFDGRRWHRLGPEEGFPANAPFFITEDSKGSLWLAGIRGITRVDMTQVRQWLRTARPVHAEMVLNERGDRMAGQQGFCCNGAGNDKGFIEDDVLWLAHARRRGRARHRRRGQEFGAVRKWRSSACRRRSIGAT